MTTADRPDFSKLGAREWAAGLRLAIDTTPSSFAVELNRQAAVALADYLSVLASIAGAQDV